MSRGRIFFVSSDAVYAIGSRAARPVTGTAVDEPAVRGEGAPAYVQVSPTELVLKPGQTTRLVAKVFDARGRYLRDEKATWTLEGLKGTVTDGALAVAADQIDQAGIIRATVGDLKGEARARVTRALPWTETFDTMADGAVPAGWVNAATGKYSVVTLDGQKVLQKPADETIFQRLRMFMGPVDLSNYTIEADVRSNTRRRQMSDIGVTAQRYTLVLYGTTQKPKLEPWEPETDRTVTVPYTWEADKWVHLEAARREPAERRSPRAREHREGHMLQLLQAGLLAGFVQAVIISISTPAILLVTHWDSPPLPIFESETMTRPSFLFLKWFYVLTAIGLALTRNRITDITAIRLKAASRRFRSQLPFYPIKALIAQLAIASVGFAFLAFHSPPTLLTELAEILGCRDAASLIWPALMSIGTAVFGANAHAAVEAL